MIFYSITNNVAKNAPATMRMVIEWARWCRREWARAIHLIFWSIWATIELWMLGVPGAEHPRAHWYKPIKTTDDAPASPHTHTQCMEGNRMWFLGTGTGTGHPIHVATQGAPQATCKSRALEASRSLFAFCLCLTTWLLLGFYTLIARCSVTEYIWFFANTKAKIYLKYNI